MILIALLMAQMSSPPVMHLQLSIVGERCAYRLADVPVSAEQLKTAINKAEPATLLMLSSVPDVPYRCVGGVIYQAQARTLAVKLETQTAAPQ